MTKILVAAIATGGAVVLAACGADDPPSPDVTSGGSASQTGSSAGGLDGRLMYSRFDESTHTFLSTHVADADGTDEVELPLPGPEGGGRWSHSGAEIAVMTILEDERVGTAIISPDGNVERVLDIPDPTLNLVCTVWAPDDTRLACEGWDDADASRTGIYSVRADDGGDLVRVTEPTDGFHDVPGDYSPDGSTLLFKRARDEDEGPLLTVAVTGGRPHQVSSEHPDAEDPGRYSPDGDQILTSSHGVLLLLTTEGAVVRTVSSSGHYLFGAVWSPDGEHIAYSDAEGGPFADVFVAAPDGSDPVQVTHTPDNEIRVEWGPEPS